MVIQDTIVYLLVMRNQGLDGCGRHAIPKGSAASRFDQKYGPLGALFWVNRYLKSLFSLHVSSR